LKHEGHEKHEEKKPIEPDREPDWSSAQPTPESRRRIPGERHRLSFLSALRVLRGY